METNWKAVGQAFENTGTDLRVECENMEVACEEDDKFEIVYHQYALLLNMVNVQRKAINALFDTIDEEMM